MAQTHYRTPFKKALLQLKQIWLEPDKKSAKRAAAALIDDNGKRFPDAVRCLEEGLEDSLSFYDFPEVDKMAPKLRTLVDTTLRVTCKQCNRKKSNRID